MHIAFLDTAPLTFGGGYEHFLLDAASFGTAAGHRVTIIVPTRHAARTISLLTNLTIPKTSVPEAEVQRRVGRARVVAVGLRGARKAVASADVIYCKNEPQELLFALMARSPSVPLIVGFHSATKKTAGRTALLRNGLYLSPPYRRLFRSVDAVHLLHAAEEEFVSQHLSYPLARVHTVPNGIDLERFKPNPTVDSVFRVLFAGRFTLQKGADVMFGAIAAVNSQIPDAAIHFTLVGDGPLRSLAEELSLTSDNVTYLGYADDIPAVYNRHDLVVVPSRWETFGLVAREALSSGVPVVVADIDVFRGLAECEAATFSNTEHACLTAVLLRCYEEWLSDGALYESRRRAARLYAEQHFDCRSLLDRFFRTITEVASVGPPAERSSHTTQVDDQPR